MAPESIDTKKPLHQYWVDSLLAIELRNWFAQGFAAQITVFDIVEADSFEEVGKRVARRSKLCQALV